MLLLSAGRELFPVTDTISSAAATSRASRSVYSRSHKEAYMSPVPSCSRHSTDSR